MSRYETYKPSGIDWIGEIPIHFRLRRFKNDFGYVKGKNPKETFFLDEANGRDADMPYLSMEYLRNENAELEFPERDEKLVSVADGESLLLWDGSNAGEFIKSKKGYLSSTMVRIDHSGKIHSKYAFYIFQCYERILRDFTNGMGIPHVNGVLLNNTYLPITFDKSEQLAIANYLDEQTQKIDRLIANKKAQADKLKELRQIEINNAVTKGLNPNAEMKDSGIEWLGKIPKHWKQRRFKYLSYMKGRIGWQGLKNEEFTFNEDEPFLITGMNFKDGEINWSEVYHIPEERYDEAPEIQLHVNDVLMTKDGTIGKLLFVNSIPYPSRASLNSHLLVFRPFGKSYFPRFLYYQLQSNLFQDHIELTKTGTTFFGITQEAVGNYKVLLPDYNEQIEIADLLDKKLEQLDRLIKNIQAQIEKLQELRKIKIYEAVTGKVRTTDLND